MSNRINPQSGTKDDLTDINNSKKSLLKSLAVGSGITPAEWANEATRNLNMEDNSNGLIDNSSQKLKRNIS